MSSGCGILDSFPFSNPCQQAAGYFDIIEIIGSLFLGLCHLTLTVERALSKFSLICTGGMAGQRPVQEVPAVHAGAGD